MHYFFHPPTTDVLDIVSKWANILIAVGALVFSIYIFFFNKNKDDEKDKKDRKYENLRTIILEHNLNHFFNFYEELHQIIKPISQKKLTDEEKGNLNDEMQSAHRKLRLKFTDLLLAVDRNLYSDIMDNTDVLVDQLTEKLFDDGINLQHPPKFEEEMIARLSTSKTNNVRVLYDYNQ